MGAEGRVQSSPSFSGRRIHPIAVADLSTRWHSEPGFIFASLPGKLCPAVEGRKTFACFPIKVLISCTVIFVFYTIIIYCFPWGLGKGHFKGRAVITRVGRVISSSHTHTHTHTPTPHNCSRVEIVKVQVTQSCPTLRPCGLYPAKLLCPWNSPGKRTGVGCHFPFQGIFPTQGLNLGLLHFCRQILYHLSHQGSLDLAIFFFSSFPYLLPL